MYRYYISKNLKAKLKKVDKKNRKLYEVIIKKIEEIIKNPQHYKPLRYDPRVCAEFTWRNRLFSSLKLTRKIKSSGSSI